MGRTFACLMLILGGIAAGPVSACINDSELPTHEREFRSQYAAWLASPPPIRRNENLRYGLVAGTGSVLLLAGVAVAVQGGRTRS